MNLYWLIPIGALVLLGAVVLLSRKKRSGSSALAAVKNGTFGYDPKHGMMIVVGGQFPGIKLPKDLPAEQVVVVSEYLQTCMDLGLCLSYADPIYGGTFSRKLMDKFEEKERAYAALGYQPLSPNAFTKLAGWNTPLPDDEPLCYRTPQPRLFAQMVREYYAKQIR